MYPLQFEIDVKAYQKLDSYGQVTETLPARKVLVFSWALVSGNSVEVKEDNVIHLRTNERLQVIAPPGTFRRPAAHETLEVVVIEGQEWTLTDTEEKHEANPWWSPGLSIFWFDREAGDYQPPLPGDGDPGDGDPGDGDPGDGDPGDGDPGDPGDPGDGEPPAYAYNPYADEANPLYNNGAGGPYGGTKFFPDDDYNPYADQNSPFHGQGGGPYGNEWPAGQSAEARNDYQAALGNVG